MLGHKKIISAVKKAFATPIEQSTVMTVTEGNQRWKDLVFEGHVWAARMNTPTWLKMVNLPKILLIAFIAYDLSMNSIVVKYVSEYFNKTPATLIEKMMVSPFSTMIDGGKAAYDFVTTTKAKKLDLSYIHVSDDDDKLETATSYKDLPDFINENIASLNKSKKLAYDCDQNFNIHQSLANKDKTFDLPKCKIFDDMIFIGSVTEINVRAKPSSIDSTSSYVTDVINYAVPETHQIQQGYEGEYLPLFGVFKKLDDGKWTYFNLNLSSEKTHVISNFKTIDATTIPRAIAKAFPELISQEQEAQEDQLVEQAY